MDANDVKSTNCSDTNDISKKLDVADNVLTKLKVILKKHWGILLFILFSYCMYLVFTKSMPATEQEQVQEYVVDTVYTDDIQYSEKEEEYYKEYMTK